MTGVADTSGPRRLQTCSRKVHVLLIFLFFVAHFSFFFHFLFYLLLLLCVIQCENGYDESEKDRQFHIRAVG